MIVYDMDQGRYPWREEIEDRRGGRRARRADGTYMGYDGYGPMAHYGHEPFDPYMEEERRRRHAEAIRRYHEDETRRPVGYVRYPRDGYGDDDEYYEGNFRVVRGREY